MIRGKTHHCPFGLSIPGGCKSAGGSVSGSNSAAVSQMQVIDVKDDDLEEVIDSNIEILLAVEEPGRCPFADMIIEDREAVDCKFDESLSSMPAGNVGLNGSPLYPHTFVGNMSEAQYGYPLDHYSDNNESRNVYYGLYSLIG
tara:strand:+ start:8577 stop:9005 length:429 start_codon:yes stop_codon:yes gene_type:complete